MPQSRRKKGLGIGLGALIRKAEGVVDEVENDVESGEEVTAEKEGRDSRKAQSDKTSKSGRTTGKAATSSSNTKSGKQTGKKKDGEASGEEFNAPKIADAQTKADRGIESNSVKDGEVVGTEDMNGEDIHTKDVQTKDAQADNIHTEPRLEGSVLIEVAKVIPNPNQPRKNFTEDDMDSLVESIRRLGVLQPIIVCKQGDTYQLVAGERRLRASQKVGLELIPALIKDYSSEEVTEIALVENLQRQNLDPIEEAFAYQRLMDTFKQTQDTIAGRLGRSRSYIANIVRLLNLPDYVRNDLSAGELTIGQARPLLALTDEGAQREVWALIKEKELNARQIEALVKRVKEGKGVENKKPAASIHETAELRAMVDRLKLSLGVKAAIKLRPGKQVQGRIELPFKNEDELNYLIQYMEAQQASNNMDDNTEISDDVDSNQAVTSIGSAVKAENGQNSSQDREFIEELEKRPFRV